MFDSLYKVLLVQEKTKNWMQSVAQEFNLSETAFVWRRRKKPEDESDKTATSGSKNNDEKHYQIRYFTPSVEVPLCGHATLSAAAQKNCPNWPPLQQGFTSLPGGT